LSILLQPTFAIAHPPTTSMSKNLMDTEPGGEQTQYEGVHTFVEPHNKQAGQLGGATHP
jgi:hypothetical protein